MSPQEIRHPTCGGSSRSCVALPQDSRGTDSYTGSPGPLRSLYAPLDQPPLWWGNWGPERGGPLGPRTLLSLLCSTTGNGALFWTAERVSVHPHTFHLPPQRRTQSLCQEDPSWARQAPPGIRSELALIPAHPPRSHGEVGWGMTGVLNVCVREKATSYRLQFTLASERSREIF